MRLLKCLQNKTIFLVSLLSIILPAVCVAEDDSKASSPQATVALQEPVARVNGTPITSLELQRAVDELMATQPDAKLASETMKRVNTNVLEELISRELLYQAGMKLEIKELEKLVEGKIAQIKSGFVSDAYFQKALRSKGMSEKDAYDDARHDIVIANFISKAIDAKISVTGEEIKKIYDQNIDNFTQPEQVRVNHILIPTKAAMSATEKKKARERAEELRKELLNGADFVELAKAHSGCPSAPLGGDLGYNTKKELEPEFARAAFALKPGEISDVVESKAGYHIIKLRDRRLPVTKPFFEVKAQIEEYLKKLKSAAATQKFLEEARKTAKIEVLLK